MYKGFLNHLTGLWCLWVYIRDLVKLCKEASMTALWLYWVWRIFIEVYIVLFFFTYLISLIKRKLSHIYLYPSSLSQQTTRPCLCPTSIIHLQGCKSHLWDSRGDTVSDTLVYGIRQPLAVLLLHKGQKSLFKHIRSAEHHHSQGVIWESQVQRSR